MKALRAPGVWRRIGVGGAGLLSLLYGLFALFEVWRVAIGRQTSEGAGILLLIGTSSAFVGVQLARESMRGSTGQTSLVGLVLDSFGKGWLLGTLITVITSLVRGGQSTAGDPLGFVINAISVVIVSLMVAIPGLAALSLAKRTRPPRP